MALIAILISLFIERFLGSLEELRRFDWLTSYTEWLRSRLPAGEIWQGPLGLLVVVAGPVVAVLLILAFLTDISWLLVFFFSILALLYSFGPKDLEAQVEAYVDAKERDDAESACWHATELLGQEPEACAAPEARLLVECILVEAHERLLAVMFWFVLLGPVGALLYRMACQLRAQHGNEEGEFADAVKRLHYLLGWLPARLTALAYALGGSFVEAMHSWREEASRWDDANRGILISSGLGAMRFVSEDEAEPDEWLLDSIKETVSLVRRAVLVFLTLLALLILAGWAP